MPLLKNIIIQKESEDNVRQWHLNREQYIAMVSAITILLGAFIFISAEYLGNHLYEKRLHKIKNNYVSITKNLQILKERLNEIDENVNQIEEKDLAIRSYAGMPEIDQEIRKLGIGGRSIESAKTFDNFAPVINKELATLELDVEKLSREVNFELNSYSSIYEKVQEDIRRIAMIPSIRPVEEGYLNSTFGYRNDPIDNVKRFHQGQDITVKTGTPIYAPADGIVKRAYYAGGFGNHIKLQHGAGYTTLYAHLSKIKVKHGQKVKRGDIIGLTGNTGRSTAPHLHYEIHHNGKPQNPLDYFFSDAK